MELRVVNASVAALLIGAREQRVRVLRDHATPIDSVHFVRACLECGALSSEMRGPGEAWSTLLGVPRVESIRDAAELIDALASAPRPTMNRDDPALCACATRGGARSEVLGARWYRNAVGSGYELCLEAERAAAGSASVKPEWQWRIWSSASDGPERLVADSLDDARVQACIGRPLAMAPAWREILSSALAGEPAMCDVEPGLWVFAGPADSVPLANAIETATVDASSRIRVAVSRADVARVCWAALDPMALAGITSGTLHAGVIVDRRVLRALLRTALARAGAVVGPDPGADVVVASHGQLRCSLELSTIAAQSVAQMLSMSEVVAVAVGEVIVRCRNAEAYLNAIAARRPQVRFAVHGFTAWPVAADESVGRPIELLRDPRQPVPDPIDLERDARYACDRVPSYVDPTRVCACGAAAWVAARLLAWREIEGLAREANGDPPIVSSVFRDETAPLAGTVVAICCERHTRVVPKSEASRLGLIEPALSERLVRDRGYEVFSFTAKTVRDTDNHSALLVHGELLASVFFDDGLIAALHHAAGTPLPLDAEVVAVVTSPGVLVLHDAAILPDTPQQLLSEGSMRDGLPSGATMPFTLTRKLRLDRPAIGRFYQREQW